jgi:hypothetical protein
MKSAYFPCRRGIELPIHHRLSFVSNFFIRTCFGITKLSVYQLSRNQLITLRNSSLELLTIVIKLKILLDLIAADVQKA